MKAQSRNKTSTIVAPIAIFLIAFIIRLVYIYTGKDNPFFTIPIVDMQYYWDLAGQICSNGIGGVLPQDMAWKPMLYPLFLFA